MRKGSKVDSVTSDENYNALNRFAINLNEMARKGKLDPVIGRDEEIRRVLQILSRRTKNNPILFVLFRVECPRFESNFQKLH